MNEKHDVVCNCCKSNKPTDLDTILFGIIVTISVWQIFDGSLPHCILGTAIGMLIGRVISRRIDRQLYK